MRPTGRERGVFSPSMCAMEWLWNRYPVGIITGAEPRTSQRWRARQKFGVHPTFKFVPVPLDASAGEKRFYSAPSETNKLEDSDLWKNYGNVKTFSRTPMRVVT